MSTDLERLLRTTLAQRAGEVTTAPEWTAPSPARRGRVAGWIAAATAAVVVAGVAVAVSALGGGQHRRSAAPATGSATSPAPRPPAAACETRLPASWVTALNHSPVATGGRGAMPLSIAADGSLIAVRDDGATPGSTREVIAIAAGRVRVLYRMPSPDGVSANAAFLDGRYLAVGLAWSPRPPKGEIPGSSAIGLLGVVVVDTMTGRSRMLAGSAAPPASSGPAISALVGLGGTVYWDVEPHYGAPTGRLYSYALSTGLIGTPKVVYSGDINWPMSTAAGIGWTGRVPGSFRFAATASLPSPVERAMSAFSRVQLATDGTSWAWLASPTVVGWWTPGRDAPVYLRLPAPVDIRNQETSVLVAGRYVLLGLPVSEIVDVPDGSVAPMSATGPFSAARRGGLMMAAGGLAAGVAYDTTPGHFIGGYWADPAPHPLLVRLDDLPPLRC